MISLISSLSIKLDLDSLVYHRNIFGPSSKVFGNLRKSSDIFVNFRKFSENILERSSGLRNNFGKCSEIFGRWSEIFRKSSKTPSSACLYNNLLLTEREGRTGEYWPEVVAVRTERSEVRIKRRRANIPRYGSS